MSPSIEKQYVRGPQTTSGLPNQIIPETPQLDPRNTLIWSIISQIGVTPIKQRVLELLTHCREGRRHPWVPSWWAGDKWTQIHVVPTHG